jgi:putative nucleotidyltransferase with HDIG domain
VSIVLKKNVNELENGMMLAEKIYCPQTNDMLLKEGTILSDAMIFTLKTRQVSSVQIAEKYTLMVDPIEIIAKELKGILLKRIATYAPDKCEANTSDKMVEIAVKAKQIAILILEDPEIIEICVEMKLINSKFLYHHGICTCALSLLVAGIMGVGDTNMKIIGKAALIHDIGWCEMAHVMGIQPTNRHEETLGEEHALYGYYLAKERNFREEICEIIHHHHENWNGTGYPNHLMKEMIPLGSRIIIVCGNYDELIHQENYKSYQAIEYIYGAGGIYFDSDVVNAMCDNLAVYPLGSLVRLSTGDIGIISNVRKNKGPRPIVRIFFNKFNKPYSKAIEVDLGKERTVFIKELL